MSEPLVLIIEDEAPIRRFLRTALEGANCRVVEAETVKRGLIEAGSHKPDLVIKYAALIEKKFSLQDAMLANAIGYTYADMNIKLDEAEKLIRYALEKDPDKPEYYDSMAWALYRKGKFNEALSYINSSIEKQGKMPNAIIADHAGDIHAALGDLPAARSYWEAAAKSDSKELDRQALQKKLQGSAKP